MAEIENDSLPILPPAELEEVELYHATNSGQNMFSPKMLK